MGSVVEQEHRHLERGDEPVVRVENASGSGEPQVLCEVEVWCSYSRRWVGGFRFAGLRSDGTFELYGRDRDALLPEPLPAHLVRPAVIDPATEPAPLRS